MIGTGERPCLWLFPGPMRRPGLVREGKQPDDASQRVCGQFIRTHTKATTSRSLVFTIIR